MAKKVENKDNSKINIIIVVALVAVVVVSLALLVPSLTKKDTKKEEKKETNEKIEVTEKTISEEYGFTKDDAIKAVEVCKKQEKLFEQKGKTFAHSCSEDKYGLKLQELFSL